MGECRVELTFNARPVPEPTAPEPPIAFFVPCASCKADVVASIAILRHARGFKCPACHTWTNVDTASVKALEADFQATIGDMRRRLQAQ